MQEKTSKTTNIPKSRPRFSALNERIMTQKLKRLSLSVVNKFSGPRLSVTVISRQY